MLEIQKHKLFKDSLIKNSIYLMVTNFVTSGIGFFFWVIAARYYSPNDIGITSAIFSSVSLISMIGSLGLSRALTFYLPRDQNTDKIINSCLAISIISSIIFSLIFILGLKIWSPELILTLNNLGNVLIFIIITTGISVSIIIGATFTAGRRSSLQMIKETTYHFVKICPLIFFVGFGAIGILTSIFIGLAFSLIIGFFLLSKVWNYSPRLTLDPIIKNMAKFSAGNYIADNFYNLPKLVFPIMILNMISAKAAGYFYIAIMMAGLLYGISQSIASSFLVESSDKDKFWNNVNKSIKFNMIILIPGLILFTIFGKFILNIFNPSYAENAMMTLIILTIASVPISLINIFNTVRNAQNKVSSMIKMNVIVAIITIALSIPLIKIMNIEGVAISYLIANIIGAIIVINRIKNPKEFTLELLNGIKKDISFIY
jgi:O-antigen/teichoic acid export membrane protein